jgi:hypothetical protein
VDKVTEFQRFVDQENVNAILTHRDDLRMVCKSERQIVSIVLKCVYRTCGVGERERQMTAERLGRSARPGCINYHVNPPANMTGPGTCWWWGGH